MIISGYPRRRAGDHQGWEGSSDLSQSIGLSAAQVFLRSFHGMCGIFSVGCRPVPSESTWIESSQSRVASTAKGWQRMVIDMSTGRNNGLIRFLQDDLAVSQDSINMALRHCEQDPGPLPMVLWQYGLINLEQLEKIYDWLEAA